MHFIRTVLIAAAGFATIGKTETASANSRNNPIPPSKDPWYAPPVGYEKASPGTVFKVRTAPGNLTSIFNASAVYNILYRTTDSRYQPTFAVTTLYVPLHSTARGPAPLLTWLHPYDSNDIDSSPSYLFYKPAPFTADLPASLARGWYVNVPDYEGPKASFTAGVMTGHATLDSVRAVLAARLGISTKNPSALWGYSGGGLAAEWAAELQVQYAPELNFVGAAFGSPVPNVTVVLNNVNNAQLAGLIPAALLGLVSQYPDAERYLLSQLKPETKDVFLSTKTMSWVEEVTFFLNQNISEYFTNGISVVYTAPEMQKAWNNEMFMGYHGVPQMPLFVYQAIGDELTNIELTDSLIERFCGVGVNARFERNTIGGHIEELTNGGPSAVKWLSAVFDGTYSTEYSSIGCTIENVTIDLGSG